MKKSLLALAVLGTFAGVASAQSSVTLFGVVDVNARVVKNGDAGTRKSLSSDGLASSRFGFRGVEDLGGGLKAGFWLEAGFKPDTGETNTKFFNRRSTVSLIGNFGEVRLGRDYSPNYWVYSTYDPFGYNGVGGIRNFFGEYDSNTVNVLAQGTGAQTIERLDNAVAYFLPTGIGGLYGQATVAAGEGTVGNKYYGGRLGYAAGPFDISAAYGQTEITDSDDHKLWNVGGSWDFGVAKLLAQFSQQKFDGALGLNTGRKQNLWLVGASAPLGQGEIRVSYTDLENKNGGTGVFANGAEAKQLALGYVYNLSKRTAFYGNVAEIKNDGASRLTVGGTSGAPGIGAGQNSRGAEVGVRHSF